MRLRSGKGVFVVAIICLFVYLSLYTWNIRTGVLDALSGRTGLEFVGWVIKPGKWLETESVRLWRRYVHLVGVREENEELRERVQQLTLDLNLARENAAQAPRLRRLLSFSPPRTWRRSGARVISQRLGPQAVLETLLVDKGSLSGGADNSPVITPDGVVGRILRTGLTTSSVLLITDRNSRIPVTGRAHRTAGIMTGRGPGGLLEVRFVPQNAPLEAGEILVTSGLAGIFPKGLPTARVVEVERSDISLFLKVRAEPLISLRDLEEVLVLTHIPAPPEADDNAGFGNATASGNATAPDDAASPVEDRQ